MISAATVVAVSISIFGFSQVSHARPQCNGEALTSCDQLARAPLDMSKSAVPGFAPVKSDEPVFNSFAFLLMKHPILTDKVEKLDPEIQKYLNRADARKDTALAIAEHVRGETKAMLIDETKTACERRKQIKGSCDDLFQERDALIKRLDLVQMNPLSSADMECSTYAPEGLPQGGYVEESHSIGFCPAALGLSDDQTVQFVAHELGHAIDSCTGAKTLFKMNTAGGDDPLQGCEGARVSEESNGAKTPVSEAVFTLRRAGGEYSVLNGDDPSYKILAGERCGFIKAIPGSKVLHSSLFASSQACRKKTYAQAYENFIAKTAFETAQANSSDQASEAKQLRNSTPPECMRINQEHFADSVAAKVVGRLAKSSQWSASDVRSTMLFHHGIQCKSERSHSSFVDDMYPTPSVRVATLLNDPELAKRLDCQRLTLPGLCPLTEEAAASQSTAPKSATAKAAK